MTDCILIAIGCVFASTTLAVVLLFVCFSAPDKEIEDQHNG